MAGESGEDDSALMRRVAAGDATACRTVVDRHLPRVLMLSRRMLGDAAEAEDVAQEAMLRLWQMAGRWRESAPIGGWLYRVTHNLAIDHVRRRRPTVGLAAAGTVRDPSPSAAELIDRRRRAAAVEQAIAALPERQRTAITLAYHLELGNIEAAGVMGLGVEALESLLARARRALRTQLIALKQDMTGTEP